jgi:hypothetical protein
LVLGGWKVIKPGCLQANSICHNGLLIVAKILHHGLLNKTENKNHRVHDYPAAVHLPDFNLFHSFPAIENREIH